MSLDRLLANSVTHERLPVEVDRRLTIAAWVSLGLLFVQILILDIGRSSSEGFPTWGVVRWAFTGMGHPTAVLHATVVAVGAGLIGAVVTRGFTRATTAGQSGQLGLMFSGALAAIPAAWIVLVGLVILIVGAAVVATLVYLMFAMLLDL